MTIFKMEWQTNRKGLILWSSIVVLILVLFMSVFPTMQTSVMKDMLDTKLGGLPENMLKIFHLNDGPSLLEPVGYFGYIFQYIFIAASIYAAMLGSKSLVKEESNGTIEFLYAQPVSRTRIVMEKFIAAKSMLAVFWLICFLASLCAISFFNHTDTKVSSIISDLFKIFIPEFFVLLFFLAVGCLISSVLRTVNQSTSVSLGLVFGFYLLGILGDLQEKLSMFKTLSPMAQGGPANLLAQNFDFKLMILLTTVSILSLFVTIVIYKRKDLQI
ncbi:ABC transporter permease [Vagococcus sp. BWB3-3]|uniref:ABC transporter permease n=1 Tax=Vagococcus allomyrinae TaxID=2794353 RepID=A0A940SSB4_9ENTE|nr:ABC transporter permease subunit [Vagococcus allomyrinae]MBP1041742.1 ABC transporter permease [Vagococcus allomyrinae]